VTSVDGMTADFFPFEMAFLGRATTRIINEVKGVNRVVYDVTSKPPGTRGVSKRWPPGAQTLGGPVLTPRARPLR
jgi:hypothetical protein